MKSPERRIQDRLVNLTLEEYLLLLGISAALVMMAPLAQGLFLEAWCVVYGLFVYKTKTIQRVARNFAIMETYSSRVDRHHRYHCAIHTSHMVVYWGNSYIPASCIVIKHGTRVNNVPSLSRNEKKKNKNLSNRKIRQAGKSSILEVLSGK